MENKGIQNSGDRTRRGFAEERQRTREFRKKEETGDPRRINKNIVEKFKKGRLEKDRQEKNTRKNEGFTTTSIVLYCETLQLYKIQLR